jgi:ring-1,2-phenylacetyl-CoA epoxidase subunit PaaD
VTATATFAASGLSVESAVRAAVAAVNDPEYPDVSILDLGLLESLCVEFVTEHGAEGAVAHVGLIPTFSGCPALKMIADDVQQSVESLECIDRCVVSWLAGPVWDSSRLSAPAQSRLAEEYTVVLRRKDGSLLCPVCGSDAVVDQAMAGPTRCRSVAWCPSCRNPVEVMR